MSRRAFRIMLGVSSRSVADWKRRSNRVFWVSRRAAARSWSDIWRISAAFIVASPSMGRLAADEPALHRHLVSHLGERLAGGRLGQPAEFEEDLAWPDDRGPELRLALALSHARFQRDRGHRLV